MLPASADVYIALWFGDPLNGGLEMTAAGYSRQPFQDWTTAPGVGTSTRSNITPITFGPIGEKVGADYYAIHDAVAEPSTLLEQGQLTNVGGVPLSLVINVGDDVRFIAGALKSTNTD